MVAKLMWSLWALLPVAGLAYHFGPGQQAYTEDRVRDVLARTRKLEESAEAAQQAAYQAHVESLAARKAARESQSAADASNAKLAAEKEDAAYKAAAAVWKSTADLLQQAQDMLAACGSEKAASVRVAKDRALIRAGQIVEGVGDLENLLDALGDSEQIESAIAREAREQLATGYYYGARLMRSAGKPANEWRVASGTARQNFRYLAETSGDGAVASKASDLQKNLELVLNLEQSGQEELTARPLPKNCPKSNCNGLCKKPGNKTKRPPRRKDDARGAGGAGDVEGGW